MIVFAGLGPRSGNAAEWVCCFVPVVLVFLGPLIGVFLLAFIYRRRPAESRHDDSTNESRNEDHPH
jgi:hypothetical protein